jgi:hypothetical protein
MASRKRTIQVKPTTSKRNKNELTRAFNDSWTQDYAFIFHNGRPTCLICHDSFAVNKKTNLQRHYESKHHSFHATYTPGSDARKIKVANLQSALLAAQGMMQAFSAEEKSITVASLKVANILVKAMVPYTHCEIVKDCMVSVSETLFPDKKEITDKLKKVPLSRRTVTRRIEDISKQLHQNLIKAVKDAECYSLALDESTDITDIAQLAVFVR